MYYRRRKLNPRGVRKIDVQAPRRQWRRKDSKAEARRLVHLFEELQDREGHRQLTPSEACDWVVAIALESGWERGFRDTQKAALARIDEALEKGTLMLPEANL